MEFIDNNTGHIFSQETYNNSIGWEMKDPEYIFWIDDSYTKSKLSTNTFYIKQITPYINKNNILGKNNVNDNVYNNVDINKIESISIKCNSAIFKLISYKDINNNINGTNNKKEIDVSELFDLNSHGTGESNIIYKKDNNDFIWEDINNESGNDFICPFFVICMSTEPDVLLTNILIDVNYKEDMHHNSEAQAELKNSEKIITTSTVIRVGGVFTDESEKLMINSINMGVNIPKTILDAVYQSDLIDNNNDYSFNGALYNEKLKEYLINKTNIKNECGNYNGIINALNWFGWGKNVKIVKLLKTDNKILKQYIQDSFNSDDDVLESFYTFRNTSFISLMMDENQTMFDDANIMIMEKQTFDDKSDFHGEALPLLEDLFNKYIKSNISKLDSQETENNHNFTYYEPYYLYNKATILLKLAFLKYYFKKYFCPVHVNVQSASMCYHAFTPDIKLTSVASTYIIEKNILCQENCYVQIGDEKNVKENFILTNNKQYIDESYCHFSNYNEQYNDYNILKDIYDTNELNFVIPIKFYKNILDFIHNKTDNDYIYNVNIRVSKVTDIIDNNNYNNNKKVKKDVLLYNINKVFNQYKDNDKNNNIIFESFVCLPRCSFIEKSTDIYYWTDGVFRVDVCCNGKWFSKEFTLSLPKLNVQIAALEYKYDKELFMQYSGLLTSDRKLNGKMWEPELVRVNASNYYNILKDYYNDKSTHVTKSNLINLYSDTYNLPPHRLSPQYYNVILYYDINDQKYMQEQCTINDNDSDETKKTKYQNAFYIWNSLNNKLNEKNNEIKESIGLTFDIYLMHHHEEKKDIWYVVLISKETINEFKNKKLLDVSKLNMLINRYNANVDVSISGPSIRQNTINLIYDKGSVDYRFLINRMVLSQKENTLNGTFKFSKNKILACSIYNKLKSDKNGNITDITLFDIPFILKSKLSKFEFIPYSPVAGTSISTIVSSKSNIAIVSLQENENKYLQGAYNIKLHYSIDGISTQEITMQTRLKIE